MGFLACVCDLACFRLAFSVVRHVTLRYDMGCDFITSCMSLIEPVNSNHLQLPRSQASAKPNMSENRNGVFAVMWITELTTVPSRCSFLFPPNLTSPVFEPRPDKPRLPTFLLPSNAPTLPTAVPPPTPLISAPDRGPRPQLVLLTLGILSLPSPTPCSSLLHRTPSPTRPPPVTSAVKIDPSSHPFPPPPRNLTSLPTTGASCRPPSPPPQRPSAALRTTRGRGQVKGLGKAGRDGREGEGGGRDGREAAVVGRSADRWVGGWVFASRDAGRGGEERTGAGFAG